MAQLGMDVDVVESVGKQLCTKAGQLKAITAAVDGLIFLAGGNWWGGIARQFVSDWRTVHKPAMVALATAAEALGKAALRNAKEQRSASAADPGSSFGSTSSRGTNGPAKPMDAKAGADLANAGYGGEAPPGYSDLTPDELKKLGVTPEMLKDPVNGFQARILKDADGRYVISFAGTNDGWVDLSKKALTPDALNNAQGAFYTSSQDMNAALLAKALVDSVGADSVTMVGHSLGGRNAAIASVITGAKALTYNSAGISDDDLAYAMTLRGDKFSIADYAGAKMGEWIGTGTGVVGGVMVGGMTGNIPGAVMGGISGGWVGGRIGEHVEFGAISEAKRELAASGQIVNHYTDDDPLTKGQQKSGLPDAVGKQVSHSSTATNLEEAHGLKSFIF